jgi:hypothetical protein
MSEPKCETVWRFVQAQAISDQVAEIELQANGQTFIVTVGITRRGCGTDRKLMVHDIINACRVAAAHIESVTIAANHKGRHTCLIAN